MAKPDRGLVKRVVATFVNAEDVDYFFDNLTSPDWIEPLADENLFAAPPPPVQVDGGFQLPSWSAMRYLARMAAEDPKAVRKVLWVMPETDNTRVRYDYLDALLSMPPGMAAEFVPRLVGWLQGPFRILLPKRMAQLVGRLALAGFADQAIALATALFDVQVGAPDQTTTDEGETIDWPVEVHSLIDEYQYEQLLMEALPNFLDGTGLRGFGVLTDLLARAMTLEARNPPDDRCDYSFIWRPAIEPHSQNSIPSTRNAIVTAVRSAALQLVRADQVNLAAVVAKLEGYSWAVLRRIALDLIRVSAPNRSALATERLTAPDYMYDSDLHHEYWLLLHERFSSLTPEQQEIVLQAIKTGPPVYDDQDEPYQGDADIGRKAWQARTLAAISDHLPPSERAWYDQLVAENRLSDHPEFLSYMEGVFVGPTSPLNADQLAALSHEQLLEFLQNWDPEGGWNAPSAEGLGRMLESAVKADPERYAEIAPTLAQASPIYISSALQGFRNAAAEGRVFAWEPVIRLVRLTLNRSTTTGPISVETESDAHWSWARSAAAHLLDVGFNNGPAEIPFTFRDAAWSILRPLTDDADPTPESEVRFGGNNMDPSSLAINTVRGQAISSVVKYAVWVHRHLEVLGATPEAAGVDRMPEVRDVLDQHLDLRRDPSYAVHSLYGKWFPWLGLVDEPWAAQNVPNIFLPDEAHFLYWEAAWEAYISFSRPYDSTLQLLKDEYHRAIDRLAAQSPERQHPMLSWQNLASHLMVFYLRGRLTLDDELVQSFFQTGPANLRAVAVRILGRSFYTIKDREALPLDPPPAEESVDRAVVLWESRVAAAIAGEEAATYAPELVEFGWWFPSPAFNPEWALIEITKVLRLVHSVDAGHLVSHRLAALVSAYPQQTLEVLDLMMKGPNDDWLLLGEEDVSKILAAALSLPGEVREKALQITHGLGARGYRQFRSLLEVTSPNITPESNDSAGA
jgi:hypothetical protein